ncbi:MAG: hypothetical protein ABWX92_16320, partial [Mycetocola sp.]
MSPRAILQFRVGHISVAIPLHLRHDGLDQPLKFVFPLLASNHRFRASHRRCDISAGQQISATEFPDDDFDGSSVGDVFGWH